MKSDRKIVVILETGKLDGLFPVGALMALGYEMELVDGIFAAVDSLERGAHALALSTPRLNPADLVFLKALRSVSSETILLVVTQKCGRETAGKARALGAKVLLSPVDREALRDVLEPPNSTLLRKN